MTKDEALRLALEALEGVLDDSPKVLDASISGGLYEVVQCRDAITAIKAALEAKDEPASWKLVPIEPTDQMLKAMDECSTEGYDERLYAGHAASVYMAAVDVAPIPPKQESKDEPKCVAIVEVFGKDWRLDYMALPVGKHKLYAQQYTYTTPPQRTWVGLTDEEANQLWESTDSDWELMKRTEAKLKEKKIRNWGEEATKPAKGT